MKSLTKEKRKTFIVVETVFMGPLNVKGQAVKVKGS